MHGRRRDYDERDAVVRIPKGGRLADSRKADGWSRGYTPKSAARGLSTSKIRLKDEGDARSAQAPTVIYVTEAVGASRPRELSVAQQAAADLLARVVDELFEAAKPLVVHWLNTQVIPTMRAKRDDLLLKRQARKPRGRWELSLPQHRSSPIGQ